MWANYNYLGPKISTKRKQQFAPSYKGGGRFPAVFPVSWFMNCFVNSSADPAIPALFASKRFPHLSEPAPETFGLDFSTISTITILIVHHLQAPEVCPSHPSIPSLVSNSPLAWSSVTALRPWFTITGYIQFRPIPTHLSPPETMQNNELETEGKINAKYLTPLHIKGPLCDMDCV